MNRDAAPSVQEPPASEDRAIAYVEWRLACVAVWTAHREWTNAPKKDARLAHAAYEAALDREDAAATAYAGLVKPTRRPTTGLSGFSRADEANGLSLEKRRR
jgi:hypothetical protein